MKFKFKDIGKTFSLFFLFILFIFFTSSQGGEWFPDYPKGTPTGTISGKISPANIPVAILARQRNSDYGGIAFMDSTKNTFTTTPLPAGTYDLAMIYINNPEVKIVEHRVEPVYHVERQFYSVVGQYVDPTYLGNNLTAIDEQNIKTLVASFSSLQDQTCNTKNLALLSASTILSQSFKNYTTDTTKSSMAKMATSSKPYKINTNRKFWLIGGNQNKAFIICNMVREVESDNEGKTRDKDSNLVGTGHWRHILNTDVNDELIYLEKQNGRWLITSLDAINRNTISYVHSGPNLWNGYVQYTITGPLVGIQVRANKDTYIGEYKLTEVKNPSTNMVRPYRFESHEINK
jgi:hypothetical protein